MKAFLTRSLLGLGILITLVLPARAGELDLLLDKLVDKGILTPIEAGIIADETKQSTAADVSRGKSYSSPEWAQKMKIKGDIRLRYQKDKNENDAEYRHRGRVRMRLGFLAQPHNTVTVGLGMATGGSDADSARSTNQTFQNFFSTKSFDLDYAFAEWKAVKGLKLVGGKFKRKPYLWAPTNLIWDGDINPEGGSFHWTHSLTRNSDYWVNGGVWALDTGNSSGRDPVMKYLQTGVSGKEGIVDFKLAGTYYWFHGLQGFDISGVDSGGTNTLNGSGGLMYDYDSVGASAEMGFKKLFGGLPFNIDDRIALFGDFIHNSDPDDGANGWAFGAKLGHKKVSQSKTWQLRYTKAILGRDAFVDTFPNSDFYGGRTDVEGHQVVWDYALMKNVILGFDYYDTKRWSAAPNREKVFVADVLVKF